jgi:DNA-directed RNA polymerase specialized sigma24 family protein
MTFPTTAWSMLEDAKNRDPAEQTAAMNRFIVNYWRPIYCFLRARGCFHETAEDLTQEFLSQFLDHDWLAKADASRGRFRNYLLAILKRFLADQGSGRATRQKAFDQSLVPVSALVRDEERSFEPPHQELPEDVFMKQWARSLVEEVRGELEAWCRARGRPDWYAIFTAHHFPAPGSESLSQHELAGRFRSSRDQIRHAVEQTTAEFARLFRTAVAGQVGCEAEIEAEIREIERLVGE